MCLARNTLRTPCLFGRVFLLLECVFLLLPEPMAAGRGSLSAQQTSFHKFLIRHNTCVVLCSDFLCRGGVVV